MFPLCLFDFPFAAPQPRQGQMRRCIVRGAGGRGFGGASLQSRVFSLQQCRHAELTLAVSRGFAGRNTSNAAPMASGGKWFSSEADGEDSGRERPADSKSRGAAKNPKSTNFIEEMLLESEELLRGGAAAAEPYVAPPSSQSDGSDAQPQQQPQPQQHRTIAVDRSGLLGAKAAAAPQEPKNPAKTRLTELGAYLKEIVREAAGRERAMPRSH